MNDSRVKPFAIAGPRLSLPCIALLVAALSVPGASALWAGQAIIFDSATAAASSGPTSSFSFTHTIGTGSNYLLVVSFAHK